MFILCALFVTGITVLYAQPGKRQAHLSSTTTFVKTAAVAGIAFVTPAGFKEVKPLSYEDVQFNYALNLPDEGFEVHFKVTPLKQKWTAYEHAASVDRQMIANPDSAYLETGKNMAKLLSADGTFFPRQLQENALTDYNADEGKTYLVNLSDMPETRHFSYALIITLQKDHVGSLLAICFTNDKGPGFFQNINRVKNCLKFK